MKKIFSVFIFLLTFCCFSCCLAGNDISWSSLKTVVKDKYYIDLDECNGSLSSFKSSFNNWKSFILLNNFSYTETPGSGNFLYFVGCTLDTSSSLIYSTYNSSQVKIACNSGISSTSLMCYKLNLDTDTISTSTSPYLVYNIVSYPDFSSTTWQSVDTVNYFVERSVIRGYNAKIYNTNSKTVTHIISDFSADPFPSFSDSDVENETNDYLPYFISVPSFPQTDECLIYFYVGDYGLENISFSIDKVDSNGSILSSFKLDNSIVNNLSYGMSKIDFCKHYSFENNTYYKIRLLGKNDIVLDTTSIIYFLGSNSQNYNNVQPYIINSPKGYVKDSGDVVLTVFLPSDYDYEDSIYLSVQKYNLNGDYINSTVVGDSKIWLQLDVDSGICPIYVSSFCDFDTSGNYYYRINLNEFNNGVLDMGDVFYFDINVEGNINKDNLPTNSTGLANSSFDFDTTDINSLVNSTSNWVNSIFSFLNIFPSWLVTCIISGIAVVVICRILGR